MARHSRGKSLVKIFALSRTGEERLIAAVKADSHRAKAGLGRTLKLYDFGQGLSFMHYSVGGAGAQRRWFSESAEDIVTAFKQAGIKPPKIRKRQWIGRIVAQFHSNVPQADAAPAQRIG